MIGSLQESLGPWSGTLEAAGSFCQKPVEMFFYPLTSRCEMDWKATSLAALTIIAVANLAIDVFFNQYAFIATCCLANYFLYKNQELEPINAITSTLGVTSLQLGTIRDNLSEECQALRSTNGELTENVSTLGERLDTFQNANERCLEQVNRLNELNAQYNARQAEHNTLNIQAAHTQGQFEAQTTALGQIREDMALEREALTEVREEIRGATRGLQDLQASMTAEQRAHMDSLTRLSAELERRAQNLGE